MTIEQAYRAKRAEHPDLPALQCLRVARATVKEKARTIPQYVGDDVVIELPRGESILVQLEYDDDADASERLQFETESARYDDATGYAPSGWIARDGRVLFNGFGSRVDWQWFRDNYGFQQFWDDGKRNNSRHAAWLRARRLVSESFDYAARSIDAGYIGYVVTLRDANGAEIDNESCWGFENIGDYCASEAIDAAEYMQEKRAKHWRERVASARLDAANVRANVRGIIADLRNVQIGNHACAAMREHIARLRREHSEHITIIAGEVA